MSWGRWLIAAGLLVCVNAHEAFAQLTFTSDKRYEIDHFDVEPTWFGETQGYTASYSTSTVYGPGDLSPWAAQNSKVTYSGGLFHVSASGVVSSSWWSGNLLEKYTYGETDMEIGFKTTQAVMYTYTSSVTDKNNYYGGNAYFRSGKTWIDLDPQVASQSGILPAGDWVVGMGVPVNRNEYDISGYYGFNIDLTPEPAMTPVVFGSMLLLRRKGRSALCS